MAQFAILANIFCNTAQHGNQIGEADGSILINIKAKGAWGCPGRAKPRMPWNARARGMWRGPDPPSLLRLTWAEKLIVRLARLHINIKKVRGLESSSYKRGLPGIDPYEHSGSAIAYPLEVASLVQSLQIGVQDVGQFLTIVFEGTDRNIVRKDSSLRVGVAALREALAWLLYNNWYFLRTLFAYCRGSDTIQALG